MRKSPFTPELSSGGAHASPLGEDQATAETVGGRPVFSLVGIGQDVAQFITACNRLLSTLTRHTTFSELGKETMGIDGMNREMP